jgi:hypothetical protein
VTHLPSESSCCAKKEQRFSLVQGLFFATLGLPLSPVRVA